VIQRRHGRDKDKDKDEDKGKPNPAGLRRPVGDVSRSKRVRAMRLRSFIWTDPHMDGGRGRRGQFRSCVRIARPREYPNNVSIGRRSVAARGRVTARNHHHWARRQPSSRGPRVGLPCSTPLPAYLLIRSAPLSHTVSSDKNPILNRSWRWRIIPFI
jgi:hypothetical protein